MTTALLYEARVFYTVPTKPAIHVMSAPMDALTAAAFAQALDGTGWTYQAVSYYGDHDETGAPHNAAYDFHCYSENACPACGAQIESDTMPGLGDSPWDYNEWCPNGCRVDRDDGGALTAAPLGAAW